MFLLFFQKLTFDFVLGVAYFPFWWYGVGAKGAFIKCLNIVRDANLILAPGLWVKFIFVPMFGQNDLQGRLMSVFMRGANIVVRGVALLFVFLFAFVLFVLWLALPAFIIYMFLISIKPV
jgi:hypothetical protein